MRILDQQNVEITSPDLSLGYLVEDRIFICHHNAVDAVEEQWHYRVTAEYANGGKDVEKVVDVPGAEAKESWDEYEDIYRYVLYTKEELVEIEVERNKPTMEERMAAMEAVMLEMLGVSL